MNKRLATRLGLVGVAALAMALLSNCTFRKPQTQTVAPSGINDSTAKVEKSFFIGKDKSGRQKRFIFGIAPERENGMMAAHVNTHGVPEFEHANVEFRVTEKYLVGLRVNPSYPDDPSRWTELIKIPIEAHYYHEKGKDQTGRDTNEMIENTERSHWSARPMMKLNLMGIKIMDLGQAFQVGRHGFYTGTMLSGPTSISDIEFDKLSSFLGFSIKTDGNFGELNQTQFRVNLKAFDHNPSFKKTPFNEQNYKYMNVLHVMGKKTETQDQILYAAHWDLSKQHEVVLVGFPKEYERIGIATVEAWNKTLQDIGAVGKNWKPFVPVVKELKHPFDFRYTTLHWVQDIRISLTAPLGVGVTTADVNNGEILWGKVTAYGGYIEDYVKSNTQTSGAYAGTGKSRFFDSLFNLVGWNKNVTPPPEWPAPSKSQLGLLGAEQAMKMQAQKLSEAIRRTEEREARKQGVRELPPMTSLNPDHIQSLYKAMDSSLKDANRDYLASVNMSQLTSSFGMDRLMTRSSQAEGESDEAFLKKLKGMRPSQQAAFLAQNFAKTDCSDRTFADVLPGWAAGLKAAKPSDLRFVAESMIYELLLHEMGHMIGLGHQFKENIVPAKGSVPDSIYERLAHLATPENEFTNATSVMGYRAPRVEIATYELAAKNGKTDPVTTVGPGEQDKLVLRYLYKQQVTVYAPGEKDFKYVEVPQNGIIPARFGGYKTTYFPQCNDGEASFGLDPFCNRFDRGPDAKTIVSSYFDDLKDTMIQKLIAFSDSREVDADTAEYYLWVRSLRSFSRVRVFYDYMRAKLETELPHETRQLLQNEEALYEFSKACSEGTDNERVGQLLNDIFTRKPQIKELCEVNRLALKEFTKILSLSAGDHSKVDFENYFFPGGLTGGEVDYDYSRVVGTWRELGAFPMKLAALFAMQTATPFVTFGPYTMSIPNYDTPERRYSYSSLYPTEYTEMQTAVVKNNLRFANVHAGEGTRIGKAVLYMGMLPFLLGASNDNNRLPPQFVQRMRSQLNFDIGYVAVILKKADNKDDKYIAKKFNPTIYDLNTGKEANASEAYLLPEGEIVVRAENAFIVPASKFQLLTDDMGFAFAYRLTFYNDDDDPLNAKSAKTALRDLYDATLDACTKGRDNEQNGLGAFFNPNNEDFKGFLMPPNISTDQEKQRLFRDSIRQQFTNYYANKTEKGGVKFKAAPNRSTCQEAIQGMRMVVSSAAILNGYWLSLAGDYIQN